MNKRDLIKKMAEDARLNNLQAARALDAFLENVQSTLAKGDRVTLVGFGTFAVSQRKARTVRDPRFGGTMEIAARRVARFAPGLSLRLAIQNSAKASRLPS
ncbi:MAG TPA: HU family DNA-binding protein [Bryobacteraceae bacterium]|nr:HU family DNA-binding protein [Bryobacteraceae bacterium]